jgi:hypothetical protein
MTHNPLQLLPRKSDPEGWLKRTRKISSLVQSGRSLRGIASQIGVTRERVRQLLKEMGIKTATWHLRQRRRRKPTLAELKKIHILYQKGVATPRIAKELDLHPPWLRTIMAQHKISGRFRCARCGREFRRTDTRNRCKYCIACSIQLTLERPAEYNRTRYRTDPEYRKRKLRSNHIWRRSESGKKWYMGYLKKMRQHSVK